MNTGATAPGAGGAYPRIVDRHDHTAGDVALDRHSLIPGVALNQIEPLSFRFLNGFDLTRTFTLRAFVLHSTLTVEEHMRIFRMSAEQSTLTLEPLLDLRLIERMPSEGSQYDAAGRARIVPGQRYRLRRLVLHPVTEFLQGKNIIY